MQQVAAGRSRLQQVVRRLCLRLGEPAVLHIQWEKRVGLIPPRKGIKAYVVGFFQRKREMSSIWFERFAFDSENGV